MDMRLNGLSGPSYNLPNPRVSSFEKPVQVPAEASAVHPNLESSVSIGAHPSPAALVEEAKAPNVPSPLPQAVPAQEKASVSSPLAEKLDFHQGIGANLRGSDPFAAPKNWPDINQPLFLDLPADFSVNGADRFGVSQPAGVPLHAQAAREALLFAQALGVLDIWLDLAHLEVGGR